MSFNFSSYDSNFIPGGTGPGSASILASQQLQQNNLLRQQTEQFQQQTEQLRLENQAIRDRLVEERQAQAHSVTSRVILLYSQNRHPIFLGCLSCNPNSQYSMHNANGKFGSSHGKLSVYNHHGIYGSASSNFSPCNPRAIYPPILENDSGKKYGLLTLNTRLFGAVVTPAIVYELKTNI